MWRYYQNNLVAIDLNVAPRHALWEMLETYAEMPFVVKGCKNYPEFKTIRWIGIQNYRKCTLYKRTDVDVFIYDL